MRLQNWSLQQGGKLRPQEMKTSREIKVDLTIDKEEVQQRSLQNKDQPVEQLDEVIEEIKRLMLESAQETVSRRRLNRGRPAIATEKKQQHQQKKQQGKGADEQLQEKVWDPGGSQQQSRGNHEQELMIFPAVEYDVGASLASMWSRTNISASRNFSESQSWRFSDEYFEA
jgi:hypothetical protein